MKVFDRTSQYDPNIDAIVRIEARRLRGKLKAYYEEGPGTADPVLIGLRPGSYVPVFRWLDAQPEKYSDNTGIALPAGRTSVAVLPLVNMSPEPEQDYFCDGISEEITNSLMRVSGLNVIARTSAFHFKGASVVRSAGRLRAWFEHRWDEADRLYDRVLKFQPGYAPAHMFRAMVSLC